MNLSLVKSSLSEVVRSVRRSGASVIITVDGEPAARIEPISEEPRELTASEAATVQALLGALTRIPQSTDPFDATVLLAEGRR
jgi:prevent-host-death family protein